VATHMFTIHGKWWNQRLRLDGRQAGSNGAVGFIGI